MVQSVEVCLDSRQQVSALLTAMAGMVGSSIDQAMEALLSGNCGPARTVLQREPLVNRMEMRMDATVLEYLGQKNLAREEVRFMASVLKVNKDLERMADLAANICRKLIEPDSKWEQSARLELQPLAIAVSHVCRKALQAVARQNRVLAESVQGTQETVRAYHDYVLNRARERLGKGSSHLGCDMALLLASNCLEQIAGHAVKLAGDLLFGMTAKSRCELLAG